MKPMDGRSERSIRLRPAARVVLTAWLAAGLTGCASIIHGGSQNIQVASTPGSATVTVDGVSKGTTPVTVNLKRGAEYNLRIELAGYQPYDMKLSKGLSGWVWGNILIGGPLGVIIDASTGAMYKVKPSAVDASLSRGELLTSRSGDTLRIGVTLEADPAWECIGTLTPVKPK